MSGASGTRSQLYPKATGQLPRAPLDVSLHSAAAPTTAPCVGELCATPSPHTMGRDWEPLSPFLHWKGEQQM